MPTVPPSKPQATTSLDPALSASCSQWLGLHNHEQHRAISEDFAGETTQGWICHRDNPCRVCLLTEIKALRAQVQAVRDICDKWAAGSHNPPLGVINAVRNILDDGDT